MAAASVSVMNKVLNQNKTVVPTTPPDIERLRDGEVELDSIGDPRHHQGTVTERKPVRTVVKDAGKWTAEKVADQMTYNSTSYRTLHAASCGMSYYDGISWITGPVCDTMNQEFKHRTKERMVDLGLNATAEGLKGAGAKLIDLTDGMGKTLREAKEAAEREAARVRDGLLKKVESVGEAVAAAVGGAVSSAGGSADTAAKAVEGAASATTLLIYIAGFYLVYRIVRGPSPTLK